MMYINLWGSELMTYKINKTLKSCPNPYYINVCWFHLKKPRLKLKGKKTVDGHPLIFIEIGAAQ